MAGWRGREYCERIKNGTPHGRSRFFSSGLPLALMDCTASAMRSGGRVRAKLRSLRPAGQSWNPACTAHRSFPQGQDRSPCSLRTLPGWVPTRTCCRDCPAHSSQWNAAAAQSVAALLVQAALRFYHVQRAGQGGDGGFLHRQEHAEIDLAAQLFKGGYHVPPAHKKADACTGDVEAFGQAEELHATSMAPGVLKKLLPTAPSKIMSL